MSQYSNPRSTGTFDRFLRYLKTRPAESWGFFIAGLLIGGFIL